MYRNANWQSDAHRKSASSIRGALGRAGHRQRGNRCNPDFPSSALSRKGLDRRLAFKGGTMLRKMVFGPRGRLSTDLDFTCRTDIHLDDLTMMVLDALEQPYHGIAFRFDKQKDWYLTGDGCAANPVCSHDHNPTGVKIKLQISTRERPILPVLAVPQIEQDYFKLLPFRPEAIPCLTLEEAVAEKIRAASQRSKLRDLHDLAEVSMRPLNKDLTRSLAVYKLWTSGGAAVMKQAN